MILCTGKTELYLGSRDINLRCKPYPPFRDYFSIFAARKLDNKDFSAGFPLFRRIAPITGLFAVHSGPAFVPLFPPPKLPLKYVSTLCRIVARRGLNLFPGIILGSTRTCARERRSGVSINLLALFSVMKVDRVAAELMEFFPTERINGYLENLVRCCQCSRYTAK